MADNTLRNSDRADVAAEHDEEPATAHDVTEGGAIGLVGGAVVGGLAGGPVGAVIGAVAGGLASAGAVDVVDKHDHDYDRTVAGTSPTGTASSVSPGTNDYDTDYRTDYQSRYANTGVPYEQYQPAYHYGHSLANDPRYQGSDWNTVETGARTDWEARYPGESGWDRFKDSVRYAWDRARGHAGTSPVGTTGGTVTGDGTTVYTNRSDNSRF